jgi:hypothetical protein
VKHIQSSAYRSNLEILEHDGPSAIKLTANDTAGTTKGISED